MYFLTIISINCPCKIGSAIIAYYITTLWKRFTCTYGVEVMSLTLCAMRLYPLRLCRCLRFAVVLAMRYALCVFIRCASAVVCALLLFLPCAMRYASLSVALWQFVER